MAATTPATASATAPHTAYQGTEKLLWGIVLAVVTFWLFAGTVGTVARDPQVDQLRRRAHLEPSR